MIIAIIDGSSSIVGCFVQATKETALQTGARRSIAQHFNRTQDIVVGYEIVKMETEEITNAV
jgi:hypothetical protein